jgi:predicted N-acetyltransferase YhbS
VDLTIRPCRPADADALREIERRAGERFRDVGLDWVADDEPFSIATLHEYARGGRSWVALDETTTVIGYVLVDVVDHAVHIEQVSVVPDRQGRGAGRRLIDQVGEWAIATGRPAITLTAFSEVPWNRPLYEHLGFRVLADHEIGPELRAVRDAEAAHGLDRAPRVCMRLDCASD